MSDQGVPPEMMDPAVAPPPTEPEAAGSSTQDELVEAIKSAARGAQLATGPTAAEDVWHFGQGAFYFAQALAQLLAPADPAAAQAEAQASLPQAPGAQTPQS